jgi:alkanesulfonate monooxygenase SsuD/methylene tetrahydromethanopterin reductase-like flavin-dependent oxidoreductase (luciferase family)
MQLWAGFDRTRERARERLRRTMEESYSLPFERFERYAPYGSPDDVAAALESYLEAGCRRFNFVADAPDLEHAIASVAEVAEQLRR